MGNVADWVPGPKDQPLPPQNGMVVSPFMPGVLDIRWDDPSILAGNAAWQVVGVNVYRSDVSDRGPFHRVNDLPIGGTFFRDRTDNVQIIKEVVEWETSWLSKASAPNQRSWVFKTRQPCVKQNAEGPFQHPTAANAPTDVTLYIDDVPVLVDDVFGPTGEIRLINQPVLDPGTERWAYPNLPTEKSKVEITYWANKNAVRSGLDATLYYRLTTVSIDPESNDGYRETELGYCPPISLAAVESLDYIWREAIRRNQWILQQGGERVYIFIRKQSGIRCFCRQDPRLNEYNKNPSQRCLKCYGTGFLGGYEGPYAAIIAPDDYERKISQTATGRHKEHTGDVWTGPTPLLTMRDMIVKQTNERYSVGPVRRPSNRGNIMQQHFAIGYIDEQDIRYKLPIDGTTSLPWPQTRYSLPVAPPRPVDGSLPEEPDFPVGPRLEAPMATNDPNTPPDKQPRGRSPVWENINR